MSKRVKQWNDASAVYNWLLNQFAQGFSVEFLPHGAGVHGTTIHVVGHQGATVVGIYEGRTPKEAMENALMGLEAR